MFTVGGIYTYVPMASQCRIDKNDGERQRLRITIVDPASAANGMEFDEVPYHQVVDIPTMAEQPSTLPEQSVESTTKSERLIDRVRGIRHTPEAP